MSEELYKGLDEVTVAESELSHVDGEAGELIYRGYPIEALARNATFEEVVYLLWYGELPSEAEYERFRAAIADQRVLPPAVLETLRSLAATDAAPMDALRTGTSMLSAYDPEPSFATGDVETSREKGMRILGRVPTIIAAFEAFRQGREPLEPDPSRSLAGDFLRMFSGDVGTELAGETFDMALILHADHGLNASTFTAMVIGSTMADLYASVTGGVGALSGPLHGGANQEVMRMFRDIEDSDTDPVEWVEEMRRRDERIPGFGHRVYRVKDPRARILHEKAVALAEAGSEDTYIGYAEAIEDHLAEAGLVDKGIAPNVDFYSGVVYDQLGIPMDLFTPIFALSRTAGWIAHVIEYQADNRLIRPRGRYTGPDSLEFVPLESR
ncbi:MAG: citrate synthase [Halobacteriales archaeon]